MTIELLYFDGCPNWEAALATVDTVLAELGLNEEVKLIAVEDMETAEDLQFPGSPTIRVDGKDIAPNMLPMAFALGCRIYWVNGKAQDAPPREWLVAALQNVPH